MAPLTAEMQSGRALTSIKDRRGRPRKRWRGGCKSSRRGFRIAGLGRTRSVALFIGAMPYFTVCGMVLP
jgi:hypothetical protein